MSARFTEAEAAAIDEARGTDDRNTWLRRLAIAAIRRHPPASPATSRPVHKQTCTCGVCKAAKP